MDNKVFCKKCGREIIKNQNTWGNVNYDWMTGEFSDHPTCFNCFNNAISNLCESINNSDSQNLDLIYLNGMSQFGADEAKEARATIDNKDKLEFNEPVLSEYDIDEGKLIAWDLIDELCAKNSQKSTNNN